MFKHILKKLKATLKSLKLLITEIEKYNNELDLPGGETTDFKLEMEKGAELVRKCSKVNRLIEILQAQGVRDVKENLTLTWEIRSNMNILIGILVSDVTWFAIKKAKEKGPQVIDCKMKISHQFGSTCISIRNLPEHIGELRNLKKPNMTRCLKLQDLPQSVMELQQLEVLICDEERKQLWEPFLHCLNNIEIRVTKEDINLYWLPQFTS
ncbi:hypothetical protein FEM48_Zijuj08G0111200 [Ziziphus jujuba var. spinosa]|uniref:RPW8 domain-containing protein n=1 Tax=Ziziphus jujuba var. spinosa TaxID=714518 RepID=A0A978UYR1_ZIZJJ|nr:hypothetical protein FEM48_Zijuj08G0111200 [Ziziphus jujuba var. spinosa]